MDDADLRRSFDRPALERAVPAQPRKGPDGAVGGVRSADPDRLRRRPRAGARRGRQGRRADRPQGRHARAHGRHPARSHEHLDDDQRDRGVAAGALHRRRRGERDRGGRAGGDDPERHHQGVPLARDLRVPARPVDAADRRHRRLHGRARPALEPGQRLLVPPAGGGRDAGAGDRLLDVDRDRGARRGPRAGAGRTAWERCSAASASSSTPACGSSRSTRSCARWRSCGTSSAGSATAWPTSATAASATACRSTRWG